MQYVQGAIGPSNALLAVQLPQASLKAFMMDLALLVHSFNASMKYVHT